MKNKSEVAYVKAGGESSFSFPCSSVPIPASASRGMEREAGGFWLSLVVLG